MPAVSRSLAPVALSLGLLAAGTGVAVAAPVPAPAAGSGLAAAAAAPTVRGDIAARYQSLGGVRSFLGRPLTSELTTPNRRGRFNLFEGGSIYWAPGVGAWETHGLIRDKWGSLGYENGRLGFPSSNETRLIGNGAFNRFQGGHIYWSPVTQAHTVFGEIFDHWGTFDWERGPLGYPTTDETLTPDRFGAFNHFERGNSIYWSPETGPAQIGGAIRDKYAALGWENSPLGFPAFDELDSDTAGARISIFEAGAIEWNAEQGAKVVAGFAEVSSVNAAENSVRLDDLQETYQYRAGDLFAVIRDIDDDPEAETNRLTLEQFEARIAQGDLLVVSSPLDPAADRLFAIVDESVLPAAPQALTRRLAELARG